MQHKWKYFIILNNDKLSHNIVECGETVDKELPLCCHIEGHYLKDNEW